MPVPSIFRREPVLWLALLQAAAALAAKLLLDLELDELVAWLATLAVAAPTARAKVTPVADPRL